MTTHRFLVAVVLLSACAAAQKPHTSNEVDAAAEKGLRTLPDLVTSKNAQELGFDSADQARSAALDLPLAEYFVKLDALQHYGGGDAMSILTGPLTYIYPVTVQNVVRSSIRVVRQGAAWRAGTFGAPVLTRLISAIRDQLAAQTSIDRSAFFVVRVPALNIYFIGHKENGELKVTPIFNVPRFGFQARDPLPARDAFQKLVPAAQAHDGLPG